MRKGQIYGLVLLAASAFTGMELQAQAAPGTLYVESNSAAGNTILKFNRYGDGRLEPAGEFSTGGKGTGAGLGNQGALFLTNDDRFIFAVNAGSNDISVLAVKEDGLTLVDRKPSGGLHPISITEHHGVAYVLNNGSAAGSSDNISGFRVSRNGDLTAIPGSTRPLSAGATGPAEIRFDEEGETLIVTEKDKNVIDTYSLNSNGLAYGPTSIASNGVTPFGFAFGKRGQVFVTDAAGGAPNASALSAYELTETGLRAIGAASGTHQSSACWAATTHDGRFVYTANTASNTITGFSVAHDGHLSLLDADGRTAATEGAPADLGFSNGDRFLYIVNGASHSISGFQVAEDGSLTPAGGFSGLPVGSTGLAVR
jgi:6-phosphogluconolactonase